jgi:ParB family transcriptional regulator, chromosome partitioning protein
MSLAKKGLDLLSKVDKNLSEGAKKPSSMPSMATPVGLMAAQGNASIRAQLEQAETTLAEKIAEVERLRSGQPIFELDPKRVRSSAFADRHPTAFADSEFELLCESIRETKGNTQPGVVRPIKGDADFDFELASGHRRHMACLRTEQLFRTEVREMSDDELVRQMVVENTARSDLSAFERGRHYALLLKHKVYSSGRELAAKLGKPHNSVAKLIRYADIPSEMVDAFADPRDIRQEWVDPLIAAWKQDKARVIQEIELIKVENRPASVYRRLAGLEAKSSVIASGGQIMGRIRQIHGCPALVLFKNAPDELIAQLTGVLEQWSKEHGVPQ